MTAANKKDYKDCFKIVTEFYGTDLSQSPAGNSCYTFDNNDGSSVSFRDIKSYFQNLTSSTRTLFSKVVTLMQLVLVLPATNATCNKCYQ